MLTVGNNPQKIAIFSGPEAESGMLINVESVGNNGPDYNSVKNTGGRLTAINIFRYVLAAVGVTSVASMGFTMFSKGASYNSEKNIAPQNYHADIYRLNVTRSYSDFVKNPPPNNLTTSDSVRKGKEILKAVDNLSLSQKEEFYKNLLSEKMFPKVLNIIESYNKDKSSNNLGLSEEKIKAEIEEVMVYCLPDSSSVKMIQKSKSSKLYRPKRSVGIKNLDFGTTSRHSAILREVYMYWLINALADGTSLEIIQRKSDELKNGAK